MVQEKLIVNATEQEICLFNNLDISSSDKDGRDLKADAFSLFYLQNPVLKEIEEIGRAHV